VKRGGLIPVVGLCLAGAGAEAHEAPAGAESSPAVTAPSSPERQEAGSRWRGSILLLDQSITAETVGVGGAYQSPDPTYEWWLALKPRYTLFDRGTDAVSLNLWMNAYLELTNSDTTTREHEVLLGPSYLWAIYGHTFRDRAGARTSATIGPRLTLPTDKATFDAGQLLGLGAIGSAVQTFRLRGPSAAILTGGRVGAGATNAHFFDRASSPVDGGLHRLREDLNGLSVSSDLLAGGMMVRDSLSVSVLADLQLLRRLDLSLSYVVINYWLYPVPVFQDCVPLTGCVTPTTNVDPATTRVNTWLTAALSYDVNDALAVSAGYYNLANQLAPYGTRRNPAWSPAARFFLTVTGNLDAIYRRLAPGGP
jgi:hypothetical protein